MSYTTDFSNNFIAAAHEYTTFEKHVPSPIFRKSFSLTSKPSTAAVTIGAAGFYELYINGSNITKGFLAPYISNPDDIVYYDKYEIADLLNEGENVIGVQLGNGMQNAPGGKVWFFDEAKFRGAPRFTLAVKGCLGEAEDFAVGMDGFKCSDSSVWFDDLRCGCFCDARREQPGWQLPGFDDSAWREPIAAETPRGEAKLCEAEPIVCTHELKAVEIKEGVLAPHSRIRDFFKNAKTEYVPSEERSGIMYDFGVNCAGVCRLKIKGEPGQQIVLQFAEYINPKGEVDYSNICFYPDGYTQRDVFTCSGGEDVFIPKFTYHGFRYCFVLGMTAEQATPDAVTYMVLNSDLKERGSFECSDETLNKIQEIIRRSDLANFYYFPTDCPHREKNGWTGDAAVSCEHMTLNLSVEKSYAEWLCNIRKAQAESGALPGIVPTGGWGFEWGNGPAWDCALTWLPYYTWLYRGDEKIVRDNATSIFRYLNYITSITRADGLVAIGLGDWVPVNRGASHYKAPLEVTDSIICLSIAQKAAEMFEAVNMPLQRDFALALYNNLRTAIRRELIDFSTYTVLGSCQTSQAMALYYGVFEPGERQQAFGVLLELIKQQNGKMDVGMLGLRVLFHVLSDFNADEIAYDMIAGPEFPSYGCMIERGHTAMPESFWKDPNHIDSLNHHFLGDVSGWFITEIVGIKVNPVHTNPSCVNIKPKFVDRLDFARAHYDTVNGRVGAEWRRSGEKITLTVEAPSAVSGRIILPKGWVFESENEEINTLACQPLKAGAYILRKEG